MPFSKVCNTCGVEKTMDEFYKGNAPGGKSHKCKECHKTYSKNAYRGFTQAHKNVLKAKSKAAYIKKNYPNPDFIY